MGCRKFIVLSTALALALGSSLAVSDRAHSAETIDVILANDQITANRTRIDHGDFLSICSRDDDFHQPYSTSYGNKFGSPKAKEKEMLSRDQCRIVKVKNSSEKVIRMKIYDRFNQAAVLELLINPKPRPAKKGLFKNETANMFYAPKYEDERLAWCYTKNRECGAKPANSWCIARGYNGASGWEIYEKREDPQLEAKFIGSGQICRPGACDTFRSITCH